MHTKLRAPLFIAVFLTPLTVFAQDNTASVAEPSASTTPAMPSLWDLAIQGGWFMIPIAIASIITIAFTLERIAGLRTGRILPRQLIGKLRALVTETGLDPRKTWEACQEHPSPLANAVKAAVLKAGRSQPEVEKAVEDAVERETNAMTRNMRPINVVASIAPLLGLLGTVQGMILAFMVTSTTTSTGAAKGQELAHGIYTALVTTFAGLSVAVVSVVLANWLEGKLERLLEKMEGIFLDLLPQFERFEGRMRVSESMDPAGAVLKVTSTRPRSNKASTSPAVAKPEAIAAAISGEPVPQKQRTRSHSGRAAHLSAPVASETLTSDIRKKG
jgi:biopolymer transport protein ExbB